MNKTLVLGILISLTSISYGNDLNDALIKAVSNGNLKEVKALIKNGADVTVEGEEGATIVRMASSQEIKDYLVANGAVESSSEYGYEYEYGYNTGMPIVSYAGEGDLEKVKECIADGVDINETHSLYGSSLGFAASRGQLEMVQYLVENGATDTTGALLSASHYGHGHLEVVKYLVEQGVDINAKDYNDNTALIWALQAGNFEMVQYLVEKGADINHQNYYGYTALMLASYGGHLELVKYLLEKGADTSKMTIIEWVSSGWLEKVQECVKKGADVNASGGTSLNNDDGTSLMWASFGGHLELVKYLLEKGADVNAKTDEGATSLMWAAEFGYTEVVKYLVEKGADVNLKSKDGKTALDIAREEEKTDVIEYLESIQ